MGSAVAPVTQTSGFDTEKIELSVLGAKEHHLEKPKKWTKRDMVTSELHQLLAKTRW